MLARSLLLALLLACVRAIAPEVTPVAELSGRAALLRERTTAVGPTGALFYIGASVGVAAVVLFSAIGIRRRMKSKLDEGPLAADV